MPKPKFFIQSAIKPSHKGLLHAKAEKANQLTKKGTIRVSYLNSLKKHGTIKEKKESNLALTLRKLRSLKKK